MEVLFKVGEKEVDELALSVGGEKFNNVSVFDAPQEKEQFCFIILF